MSYYQNNEKMWALASGPRVIAGSIFYTRKLALAKYTPEQWKALEICGLRLVRVNVSILPAVEDPIEEAPAPAPSRTEMYRQRAFKAWDTRRRNARKPK